MVKVCLKSSVFCGVGLSIQLSCPQIYLRSCPFINVCFIEFTTVKEHRILLLKASKVTFINYSDRIIYIFDPLPLLWQDSYLHKFIWYIWHLATPSPLIVNVVYERSLTAMQYILQNFKNFLICCTTYNTYTYTLVIGMGLSINHMDKKVGGGTKVEIHEDIIAY